jgi:multidrug efflux system membrane fusion protein
MRILPLFNALVVFTVLYLAIFERDTVKAYLSGPSEEIQQEAAVAEAPKKLVSVVIRTSNAQKIPNAVIVRGETAASRQVAVKAETSGQIVSQPLRKGAFVKAGQTLCELDPGTRAANLADAEARLNEAKAMVPQTQARLDEAKSRLQEATINYNNAQELVKGGYATETRVASTEAAVRSAEAGVAAAEAGFQSTSARIQSAEAAVAAAAKEISRLTLTAPFAGVLETDTAEIGALLQPGAPCATVIQLDPMKLVGFIPETEVMQVAIGADAMARLVSGQDVVGKVSFLSRSADPMTRTFRIEIDVPNTDFAIRDGQTAEILIASADTEAHLVPQSALTLNDEGILGLRIVDENNVVEFVPVRMLRDTSEGVLVTGLPKEARVIVVGQEYVVAGLKVAPVDQEVTQ